MKECPRIVVGGTASGTGKTSVTLGIVAALKKQGLVVQTFKVGPDFLDPTYLAMASGRPCYNLDGWMMGRDHVERTVARTCEDADIAVIEGVMGLFDGAKPGSLEGSTAEIALWLDAPVLLVVNTHGMAQSIAAVVKGFALFEPRLNLAGVIVNRSGSDSHGSFLKSSLKAAMLPGVVAVVPRGGLPELTSRHLGLVTANPKVITARTIDELADAMSRYGDLVAIVNTARSAPGLNIRPETRKHLKERVCLGVAFDDAFHFYYQDFFDALSDNGCAITRFSPLADSNVPHDADALYFGGGYPEVMAETLAANEPMRAAVRTFAASNRPIYAECGGLMYLCSGLEETDGTFRPMAGLIPATTKMYEKRQSLAYVEVTLKADSLWGHRGDTVRGHEFHYSRLTSDPAGKDGWESVYRMKKRASGETDEGYRKGKVLASYAHLHLPPHDRALAHFIKSCEGDK